MKESFSFFAPAFIKSGSGSKQVKIGGVISTEDIDADGEKVLTKGLDLSYFDGGFGKIKYEHDNPNSKEPDNIIGFPTKVIKKSNKVEFEGVLVDFDPKVPDNLLTPQQRNAKSAAGLLKAVEEYNKTHPQKQQRVGWSIEGEYIERKRSTGIVRKAKVTNVVLTTKPKNRNTVAKIIKSLSVGYGTSPETQTGFGATRTESIEKEIKTQTTNGGNEMTFKSKEEAFNYYLSTGMQEEEAKKKAEEWEAQNGGGAAGELPTEKSLANSKALLEKAIKIADEALEKSIAPGKDAEKQLRKSINDLQTGRTTDVGEYFEAKTESDLIAMENQAVLNEKIDGMLKSISLIADAFTEITNSETELAKSIDVMSKATKLNAQGVHKILTGKAMESGLVTDKLLPGIDYDDNDKKSVNLSKAQTLEILDKLSEEGKVDELEVMAYEGTGFIDEKTLDMVKAKANEMLK